MVLTWKINNLVRKSSPCRGQHEIIKIDLEQIMKSLFIFSIRKTALKKMYFVCGDEVFAKCNSNMTNQLHEAL